MNNMNRVEINDLSTNAQLAQLWLMSDKLCNVSSKDNTLKHFSSYAEYINLYTSEKLGIQDTQNLMYSNRGLTLDETPSIELSMYQVNKENINHIFSTMHLMIMNLFLKNEITEMQFNELQRQYKKVCDNILIKTGEVII